MSTSFPLDVIANRGATLTALRAEGTMAISEEDRFALHQALVERIGPDHARALMASLPPTGWADVATKHDLDDLRRATQHDLSALGDELRTDMAQLAGELRADMAQLAGELRTEMAQLSGELRTEMAELRSDVADRLRAQTQVLMSTLVAVAGVLVAAIRL